MASRDGQSPFRLVAVQPSSDGLGEANGDFAIFAAANLENESELFRNFLAIGHHCPAPFNVTFNFGIDEKFGFLYHFLHLETGFITLVHFVPFPGSTGSFCLGFVPLPSDYSIPQWQAIFMNWI